MSTIDIILRVILICITIAVFVILPSILWESEE